jgi:tetratricopeptide (TPR) repeat protein
MKSLIIALAILCVAATAGTLIYLNRTKADPAIAPVAETAPEPAEPPASEKVIAPEPKVVSGTPTTAKTLTAPSVPVEVVPDDSGKSSPLSRAIETLVSSQSSFEQKRAVWEQLREAKQLDQAVAALKQGAAEHPTAAEYPTALGEAYLQQAGVASRSGGKMNEMAMFGMQADQSFDAALKLDATNWEAQFYKAVAMGHWPAELNKGDEVIQRFSALIEQQETMTPQPHFAKTYILLGEQYKKMGKADYATATWQLGAAKFPGAPEFQKKINGQ